jgi:hypothetical protein
VRAVLTHLVSSFNFNFILLGGGRVRVKIRIRDLNLCKSGRINLISKITASEFRSVPKSSENSFRNFNCGEANSCQKQK